MSSPNGRERKRIELKSDSAATASNTKASAPELAANGVSAGPPTFDAVIEDSAVIFAYQFINEHFPKVP